MITMFYFFNEILTKDNKNLIPPKNLQFFFAIQMLIKFAPLLAFSLLAAPCLSAL